MRVKLTAVAATFIALLLSVNRAASPAFAQADTSPPALSNVPELRVGDEVSVAVVRSGAPDQTGRIESMNETEIRLRQISSSVVDFKNGKKVRFTSEYLVVIPRTSVLFIRKQLTSTTQPVAD